MNTSGQEERRPGETSKRQHLQNGSGEPPSQVPPLFRSENASVTQILQLMQQQMAQQQSILAELMKQQGTGENSEAPEKILDSLCSHLKEFSYDAEAGSTFAAWYCRYEDLFEKDASRLSDEAKVRLLMRKLGTMEHDRYVNLILPKHARDFPFAETVKKLTQLFGTKDSQLHRRYKCLNTAKLQSEDYLAYGCRVNRGVIDFELGKLTEEQFKCLIFVCGLKEAQDVDIRQRLLTQVNERPESTLEQLVAECQRIINLRHDSAMIQQEPSREINMVQRRNQHHHHHNHGSSKGFSSPKNPSTPCWLCGSLHWSRDCTYRSHKCTQCGRIGHKEGFCKKKHDPFHKKPRKQFKGTRMNTKTVTVDVNSVQERRKYVPIGINGVCVRLQLDTASDISVIGKKVWKHIGAPPLSPSSVETKTASGGALALIEEFNANITIGEKQQQETIYVSHADLKLLGTDLVEAFALWSVPIDQICNAIYSDENCVIASIELERDVKSVAVSSISSLPITFMEIADATRKDPMLSKVQRFIQSGWPRDKVSEGDLSRFYARREALSVVDGCILFGERVVVPRSLQQRCLRQFHRGHPGIQRMKSLARSYVYWPSIDHEISQCVST